MWALKWPMQDLDNQEVYVSQLCELEKTSKHKRGCHHLAWEAVEHGCRWDQCECCGNEETEAKAGEAELSHEEPASDGMDWLIGSIRTKKHHQM